ncbi:MAG: polysaccharide deacetylase family protein, partial [Firmicutes bacterium]|nr:polysaccharide deacetylase family protein [Bacillota bacterium]
EEARLAAELAAEQERLARQQRITDYVSAVAKGEITSDAMKGITFRQNKSAKGKVALSFDDGPFKTYTYDYLDILEEYGVKTTFFCQVQYVERYPEQLQAIVDAGHEIGCHSYAHAQLNKLSSDALRKEIEKCKEILDPFQEITLFRYPYGAYNDRTNGILKEYGLISVMWSVDTEDWAKDDPQAVIDHVKKYTKDGDIILLHEGKKVTLAALPGIITTLRDMGFEIVTVSELLYGNADELAVEEQPAEGSAPQETSGDKPVDEASASTTK